MVGKNKGDSELKDFRGQEEKIFEDPPSLFGQSVKFVRQSDKLLLSIVSIYRISPSLSEVGNRHLVTIDGNQDDSIYVPNITRYVESGYKSRICIESVVNERYY